MPARVPADQIQQAIETEFECHRCGHCCKGEGLVHFGLKEAQAMADQLGLARPAFLRQYAIKTEPGRWILKDRVAVDPATGESEIWCIFLERGRDGLYGCHVNAAKPAQCGTFPAQWRNPDSFRTCAGLRALMRRLREANAAAPAAPEPRK